MVGQVNVVNFSTGAVRAYSADVVAVTRIVCDLGVN
jgi:hypothetical protein